MDIRKSCQQKMRGNAPIFLAVRFWRSDPWRDGGTKRSAQVDEVLLDACPGAQIVEVVLPISGRVGSARAMMRGGSMRNLTCLKDFNLRVAMRGMRDAAMLRPYIRDLGAQIIAIAWEATPSLGPALNCKRPLLAFPHNMEAMASTRRTLLGSDRVGDAVRTELAILAHATHIFPIAREEDIFFRNAGFESRLLPYRPPKVVEKWLDEVRRERQTATRAPGEFLILGSATNPVTARGLEQLLNVICETKRRNDARYIVVGNGTERFSDYAGDSIKVLGRIPDLELRKLFISCSAALVHQETGSGALTRIEEYLRAGIPVIANAHAARSFYGRENMTIVETLGEMLRHVERWPPDNSRSGESMSGDVVGLEFRSIIKRVISGTR